MLLRSFSLKHEGNLILAKGHRPCSVPTCTREDVAEGRRFPSFIFITCAIYSPQLLPPGCNIVDIGANVGDTTLPLAVASRGASEGEPSFERDFWDTSACMLCVCLIICVFVQTLVTTLSLAVASRGASEGKPYFERETIIRLWPLPLLLLFVISVTKCKYVIIFTTKVRICFDFWDTSAYMLCVCLIICVFACLCKHCWHNLVTRCCVQGCQIHATRKIGFITYPMTCEYISGPFCCRVCYSCPKHTNIPKALFQVAPSLLLRSGHQFTYSGPLQLILLNYPPPSPLPLCGKTIAHLGVTLPPPCTLMDVAKTFLTPSLYPGQTKGSTPT